MAFIELNEDELAVLSEEEKAQYHKQLKLHRERAEFVKKLEQIEKADYQYKKPEFKRIKPIHRIEIPKYKDIKKVVITMPSGIDRMLNERIASQHSINDKTKIRMRNRYIVPDFPIQYKAALISVPTYKGKKRYEITDVPKTRYKIKVPTFKFKEVNKKKITDLPKKKTPSLADISFKYSRKPISIIKVKAKAVLPRIMEYTGFSDVKINNVPSVLVKSLQKKQYIYKLNSEKFILNTKARACDAKVIPPKLLFDYVKKPVKVTKVKANLPEIKNFKFDNSAKIKDVPYVSIKAIPKNQYVLKLSNEQSVSDVKAKALETRIKAPKLSFEIPVIDINGVPTIKQAGKIDTSFKERVSSGVFIKIDSENFDVSIPEKPNLKMGTLQIKDVSVPTLKKYQQPVTTKIIVDKPQKVQLPTLEVRTPDHAKDHAKGIMNRIMKGIQGA